MNKHIWRIAALSIALAVLYYIASNPHPFRPKTVEPVIRAQDTVPYDTTRGSVSFGVISSTAPASDTNKCPFGQKWYPRMNWSSCVIEAGCWPEKEWQATVERCARGEGEGYLNPDTARRWPNDWDRDSLFLRPSEIGAHFIDSILQTDLKKEVDSL